MSSLCITRSISHDSQDGFYSPSIDLGKDFEYLIRKCLAEKMAREKELSDAFGNDQSEATALSEVASLDMPLDSKKEMNTNTNVATVPTCEEENISIIEKPCVDYISQQTINYDSNELPKVPEENGSNQSGETNMTINEDKDVVTGKITPNAPGRPDEDEVRSEFSPSEPLFAEFEFPALVKGKFYLVDSNFKFVIDKILCEKLI